VNDLPPKSTSSSVNVLGLKIHYVDWDGCGTPIILIHGLASTSHIWDLVAPRLSSHGHVIAVDQRGHGLTDRPSDGYDFDSVCEDLASFVKAVGITEKFFLIGHSWGGYVALYFAERYNELLRGIVLVDGGILDLKLRWSTWAVAEKEMTPPDLTGKSLDELRHIIKNDWLTNIWTPEIEGLALHIFDVDKNGLASPRLTKANHMQIARAIWEFTPTDHFGAIGCPVLLIVPVPAGLPQTPNEYQRQRQDQIVDAKEKIRDCEVLWLEHTVHDVPWHRPDALAEAIVKFTLTGSSSS
jgi:pimeloyl-ACP methyl ester carboxylesterase